MNHFKCDFFFPKCVFQENKFSNQNYPGLVCVACILSTQDTEVGKFLRVQAVQYIEQFSDFKDLVSNKQKTEQETKCLELLQSRNRLISAESKNRTFGVIVCQLPEANDLKYIL